MKLDNKGFWQQSDTMLLVSLMNLQKVWRIELIYLLSRVKLTQVSITTLFEQRQGWKGLQNNVIILKNNELFTIKQPTSPHTDRQRQSLLFEGEAANKPQEREREWVLRLCVWEAPPDCASECGRETERQFVASYLNPSQPRVQINHLSFENELRFCCECGGRTSKVNDGLGTCARRDEFRAFWLAKMINLANYHRASLLPPHTNKLVVCERALFVFACVCVVVVGESDAV